ncbi:9122_t:CDS:2 [Gigaspora rosea]|nr:9122_t:CDS:2 [Gigaspora rosea]
MLARVKISSERRWNRRFFNGGTLFWNWDTTSAKLKEVLSFVDLVKEEFHECQFLLEMLLLLQKKQLIVESHQIDRSTQYLMHGYEEKANKSNKYCVCKEYILGSSYAEAEKNKFANTQELVRRHLKNCIYFKQKYTEAEQEEILEKSDKSVLVDSNRKSLNGDQQKHLEQLVLKATVSCGWAFSWVENPEVKALFEFIHPLIKLPSRKQLSGQILAESTQKITKSTKEIAQNNKNGVTLAYDSWKNVKKESIFGSILVTSIGKRRTENMLSDLKIGKIKVNAIVTNSTKIEEENNNNLKDFLRNILLNISKLLRSRNITAIDKLLKTYKQNIGIPPENNEQISLEDSKEELSDDDMEEDDYMQCDSFSLDESEISTDLYEEAMLQDDIHPADNLAAKWKLADIFVDTLVQPDSINLLLGEKKSKV